MAHENGTKVIAQTAYPSGGHHRHDTIDFWKYVVLAFVIGLFFGILLAGDGSAFLD